MFKYLIICLVIVSLSTALNKPLRPQPSWNLVKKRDKDVTVTDVVAVLGRFNERSDFYKGEGYSRKVDGILTSEVFYNRIKSKPFKEKNWPVDIKGQLVGTDGMDKDEIKELTQQLKAKDAVSEAASNAVFTTFAKGATNGLAYPAQVDEEMAKWLLTDIDPKNKTEGKNRVFDLSKFEGQLAWGRAAVFLGWFLYIGLQFGGIYVVFFVPIMQNVFGYTDVDFYPIQTALHTSEWGK